VSGHESVPLISVVIPNLNGLAHLRRCLPKLMAQEYPRLEVWLVDNASGDGSVSFVARQFPQVKIIRNDGNLGFATANNVAIRRSAGEYIATLNNDTAVEPGWLAALAGALLAEPDVGMCASQMLYFSDPPLVDSAGLAVDRAGMAWNLLGGQPRRADSEPLEVFGPCAGAALYRRSMLEKIGLFDADFFAYLEDVDLAWRARLAGWRCLYVPAAVVYHLHSATGGEGSALKSYLLARNKIWTVVKNYPAPQVFPHLPLIAFYDLLAYLYRLGRGHGLVALRGRLDALRKLPLMLQKRRQVQGTATAAGRRAAWRLMAAAQAPWTIARRERLRQSIRPHNAFWEETG
jgi:GT2 family glycosyltransferase